MCTVQITCKDKMLFKDQFTYQKDHCWDMNINSISNMYGSIKIKICHLIQLLSGVLTIIQTEN